MFYAFQVVICMVLELFDSGFDFQSLQTGCLKWMAACIYGIHSQKGLRASSHFSVSINTSCLSTHRVTRLAQLL
jgi:hypothetical protein